MDGKEDTRDPLDIEWLIEQAREVMKRWKKPTGERLPSYRDWQEVMDGRLYGAGGKREV